MKNSKILALVKAKPSKNILLAKAKPSKSDSPNQQREVKINVAALQQEWHKKIRVRMRTSCLYSL